MFRWLTRRAIEAHRAEMLDKIERTSNDGLAALIVIEREPGALRMLKAALEERHAKDLAILHINNYTSPVAAVRDSVMEDTAEMKSIGES